MKEGEEKKITIGKRAKAHALWNQQRRLWRKRRFNATLTINDNTIFYLSHPVWNRLRPIEGKNTYTLPVDRVEDMQEIVRAVKRERIDQTIIFSSL